MGCPAEMASPRQALTRTARTLGPSAARDRPQRVTALGSNGFRALLDRLKVQRARVALGTLSDIVAETLADDGSDILVPHDRAGLEAKVIAARFLLDLAVALDRVERLDGSKIFHGRFLGWQPPDWPLPLGGVKEGRRSDLAPRTVDCDW